MDLLFAIFFVTGLVFVANWLETQNNSTYNMLFAVGLGLLQLPLVLLGLIFVVLPAAQIETLQASGLALQNFAGAGLAFLGMALWGGLMVLGPVRQAIARALPIRADSPVHLLALVLSGYLVGNTAVTLTQGGLEAIAETAVSASILDVILQQGLFAILALAGVGLLVRRHGAALRQRLDLAPLRETPIRAVVGWIALLVVVQAAVGALWQWLNPTQAELLGGINETLLSDFDTVWEWLTLGVASGVGEELLFRGALQPIFGLPVTSVLFAIAHVQYGLTPITLVVFVLGFALGYVRQRYSTTAAILVHFGYNTTLGLLSLIAANFVT